MSKEIIKQPPLVAIKNEAQVSFKQKFHHNKMWKYIKLNDLIPTLRKVCNEHGYDFSQTIHEGKLESVLYSLNGGETSKKTLVIPLPTWEQLFANPSKARPPVQEYGAFLTYLRRYSLFILIDIFPEEDTDAFSPRQEQGPPAPSFKYKGPSLRKSQPAQPMGGRIPDPEPPMSSGAPVKAQPPKVVSQPAVAKENPFANPNPAGDIDAELKKAYDTAKGILTQLEPLETLLVDVKPEELLQRMNEFNKKNQKEASND